MCAPPPAAAAAVITTSPPGVGSAGAATRAVRTASTALAMHVDERRSEALGIGDDRSAARRAPRSSRRSPLRPRPRPRRRGRVAPGLPARARTGGGGRNRARRGRCGSDRLTCSSMSAAASRSSGRGVSGPSERSAALMIISGLRTSCATTVERRPSDRRRSRWAVSRWNRAIESMSVLNVEASSSASSSCHHAGPRSAISPGEVACSRPCRASRR